MIPPTTGPFGVSYLDRRILATNQDDGIFLDDRPNSIYFRIYYPSILHRQKWQQLAKDTRLLANWVPTRDYYDGKSLYVSLYFFKVLKTESIMNY
jgi:hypothetical protein